MLPRAHFILYTVNTNVCETDVVLQFITAGLRLIGIQHQTSLIICLRGSGFQMGREEFIFNHVNPVTCDFCLWQWDTSMTAVAAYNSVAHIVMLLFFFC